MKKLIPRAQTGTKVSTYKPVLSELGNSALDYMYGIGEKSTLPLVSTESEKDKIRAQSSKDFNNSSTHLNTAVGNMTDNFKQFFKTAKVPAASLIERPKSMY